ncbi:hypothetical protein Cgig2_016754 [Carnegiea gigantea]|uniref:Topoisomerase II-associated protein PAT1 n=1 Tax=Carnegiea gigantea TaxID=171969 RepID=A0A9Q1QR24_9CARY|nr:hypothetical protein Cgig2_016754 [Carnegiea gigantea]
MGGRSELCMALSGDTNEDITFNLHDFDSKANPRFLSTRSLSDTKVASSSRQPGIVGDGGSGSFSRESSSLFDASQYAFFNQNAVEEVELGSLEEEEEDVPLVSLRNDEYHLFDKDEVQDMALGSLSDMDDLATTFSKASFCVSYGPLFLLNRVVTGPRNPGVIGDRGSGSLSRESSSAADWSRDAWLDQCILDVDNTLDKRWSSQPHGASGHPGEYKPLYRALSYPEQQLQQQHIQQHFSSETISTPKSSFTSFPPPGGGGGGGGRPQQPLSHRHSLPLNIPSLNSGPDLTFSGPNLSPMSDSSLHFPDLSIAHGLRYGGNISSLTPGHGVSNQLRNQWSNRAGLLHGDHSMILNNVLQQHLHQNGLMRSSSLMSPRQQLQQQGLHQTLSALPHFSLLQSQIIGGHPSSPSHVLRKYDTIYGIAETRDQRPKSGRGKQSHRFNQGSDSASQKGDTVQFRSKYMSSEEIESILKMQHTSHSNDPYIDDYYHQACSAKRSSGSRLKHYFAPLHLRDLPSRARNSGSDQHGHQSFDTLRRLTMSSIRRPRPLLELDSSSGCSEASAERRSLEQEPMFAARIAVEDALTLLLDVDDIDRFLQFNPPQDGSQLRRKRLVLLEALAASLQLVDPLGSGAHTVGPGDDIVLMRLVSLPKGRKFLSRYLELLTITPGPSSELARIVCMAVFRHLRFLFGGLPSDPEAIEATANLAKAVSNCVGGMDLRGLSACLAAVVCSSEQPPLRPLGSSAGDHASLILKCLLERATEVLTHPSQQAPGSCNIPNRNFWKASFGTFFTLLTKYCASKYETIMHSIMNQAGSEITSSEAMRAIRREMPVELLRASLPHTDEHQRRALMDFAHQSIPFPVTGFNLHDEEGIGRVTSESIRS